MRKDMVTMCYETSSTHRITVIPSPNWLGLHICKIYAMGGKYLRSFTLNSLPTGKNKTKQTKKHVGVIGLIPRMNSPARIVHYFIQIV